jgi:hypothetical protein
MENILDNDVKMTHLDLSNKVGWCLLLFTVDHDIVSGSQRA